MKYLKLFEDYEYSNPEEEKKEDIEDILIIEGIFDEWPLLDKRYFDTSGTMTYEFKLEPKGNKYLHENKYRRGKEGRWYNKYYFDRQIDEILSRLNYSRIYSFGFNVKANWTFDHDGYNDDGESRYKVDIWLSVIEPSWWKGKSIPYKEVSDKEAGII